MKLIALKCPQCDHNLPAENDDIVVACPNCQTAVHIGETDFQIQPIKYMRGVQAHEKTAIM